MNRWMTTLLVVMAILSVFLCVWAWVPVTEGPPPAFTARLGCFATGVIGLALALNALQRDRPFRYDWDTYELRLARVFLTEPDSRQFGYELSRKVGLCSSVVYMTMTRLLDRGWLEDGWEDLPEDAGRPPRRWYVATESGFRGFRELIEQQAGRP